MIIRNVTKSMFNDYWDLLIIIMLMIIILRIKELILIMLDCVSNDHYK